MDYIQNVNPTPLQSPGGRSTRTMVVVVALLLVMLGVAGYAYWQLSANPNMDNTNTAPPITTTQKNTTDDDTTNAIDADLQATGDVGDVNASFSDVDQSQKGL